MSTATATIFLVESDLLPTFDFKLEIENEDGTIDPVDLTPFISIILRVRRDDGSTFERTAIIDNAAGGEFHFDWIAGNLTKGTHEAEVKFTNAVGPETFPDEAPMLLIIRDDL